MRVCRLPILKVCVCVRGCDGVVNPNGKTVPALHNNNNITSNVSWDLNVLKNLKKCP